MNKLEKGGLVMCMLSCAYIPVAHAEGKGIEVILAGLVVSAVVFFTAGEGGAR